MGEKEKTLTVKIPPEIMDHFRDSAMLVHGKERGYLKAAVIEALQNYIKKHS